MSDLFWLGDAQMARPRPYFPKSDGRPLVGDQRVLIGVIFVNRNGLQWRYAPRWKRWSEMGVFARIMRGLAAEAAAAMTMMITATRLRSKKGDLVG